MIDEFYPVEGSGAAGYSLPWSKMALLKIRLGEWTLVTGINGHGKSIVLSQIVIWLIDQGLRSCVASMELPPRRNLHRFTLQAIGFAAPSETEINRCLDWADDQLWIYDVVGQTTVDALFDAMLYARRRFDVRIFVIDSLMRLGIPGDDFDAQDKLAKKVSDFAGDEEAHVFLVAHSRKPKDESRPVGKLDVKGSGGISDNADNCISVWRNKPKEAKSADIDDDPALDSMKREEKRADLRTRHDALLICDKQRYGDGSEPRARLWFDKTTGLYRETLSGAPPALATYTPVETEETVF